MRDIDRTKRQRTPNTQANNVSRPYSVFVRFDRDVVEDEEFARIRCPESSLAEGLVEQFRAELQEAFDEGYIAGFFDILSIEGVEEF